jgi:hypothetical protein
MIYLLERDDPGLNRGRIPNRVKICFKAFGWMEVGVIARPYSLDLREHSVVRVAAGESVRN